VGWREAFNLDCNERSSQWLFIVRIPIVRMMFSSGLVRYPKEEYLGEDLAFSVVESKLGKGDQGRVSTFNILA